MPCVGEDGVCDGEEGVWAEVGELERGEVGCGAGEEGVTY